MFENIMKIFKKFSKEGKKDSKDTAKERLHLVLMQDRANVSADFLDMMKQEIIEVIKKYINVDENSIDVKLTNKVNADGTTGAPALYANIPIVSLKDETKKVNIERKKEKKKEEQEKKQENNSVETEKIEVVEESNTIEIENSKNDTVKEDVKENEIENINEESKIVEEKEETKVEEEKAKEVVEENKEANV